MNLADACLELVNVQYFKGCRYLHAWLAENEMSFTCNPRPCRSFLNLRLLFAKYSGFLFHSERSRGRGGNGKWLCQSFKFSQWIISVLNVFLWLPRDGLVSDGKKKQPLPSRCDF